ncbi:MAG: CvpA family protein [Anaeroplasma sp.]
MDFGFFGVVDIILLVFAIVFMAIGYKKGFMKKVLSFFGIIAILIFSFIYCGQFSQFMIHNNIIYPAINGNIVNNIESYMVSNGISELTVSEVLSKALNIPDFIANMIVNAIGNPEPSEVITSVANYLSTTLMNIISFFILFIGLIIILGLLKLITNVLRTNVLIRVTDGILGILLYIAIYAVIVSIAFYILSLLMNQEWFSGAKSWLEVDMQLNTDEFRLSKTIYNGNIIKALLDMIF